MIKSYQLGFCLLLVLFQSCRERVETEFPDFAAVPVLNGILIEGNPAEVHVSLASRLDSVPLPLVADAVVELYINDQFAEVMTHEEMGLYSSTAIVTGNTRYTCKVHIPGYKTVTATTHIPAPPVIHNLEHINIAGKDYEGITFPAFKLSFANDPNHEQYSEIRIKLYQYDTERQGWIYREHITDPVLLNEGLPMLLFSNEIIRPSDQYTLHVNYFTQSSSDTQTTLFPMEIEMRSVSKEYYLFARQKFLYDTGRFPDYSLNAYQAFPLYSNVENGYGIFAGYSSAFTEKIHPSY